MKCLKSPTVAILSLLLFAVAATALAADPTGIWKWSTTSPNGDIPTTLKLELNNGTIAGAYSNQYGHTAISNASLRDDLIIFDVVRDLGGKKYVVKYHGKIEGDTINGTIEAPGHEGGQAVKLDWNAKRRTKEKAADEPLYAITVPEKPGFVISPYAKEKSYIDVRGMPRGTKVKDPYTQNIFFVP